MKIIITPMADAQIDNQFQFGVDRHGHDTAQRTMDRLRKFLSTTLSDYPRTGRALSNRGLFESFVPKTPFVVVYRIEDESQIVRILGVFHHSQNRNDFDPDLPIADTQ